MSGRQQTGVARLSIPFVMLCASHIHLVTALY